jgi:hypothetical protein
MRFFSSKKYSVVFLIMALLLNLLSVSNSSAQSPITIGEALSPWDRTKGIDDQDRRKQYQADMEEIEDYYEDCAEQTDLQGVQCLNIYDNHWAFYTCIPYVGCSDCYFWTHIIAKTVYSHCGSYPDTFPYREYWMAFQKGEQVQVPYTTAFVNHKKIESYLTKSEKILYAAAPDLMQGISGSGANSVVSVMEHLQGASDQHDWDIEAPTDKVKDETKKTVEELKKFDAIRYRFRNAIPESGGYRYMVGHIFSTRLHETYRMDDKYNKFPNKSGYNWVHYGSRDAGKWVSDNSMTLYGLGSWTLKVADYNTDKPEIPDWMSEMPLPQGGSFSGMLLNYFYGPNRKYFGDMMIPGNTTNNCILARMTPRGSNTHTPQDILSDDHKTKLDVNDANRNNLKYCLPGMHGSKFMNALAVHDTTYATVADNTTFYRNLIAANRIGDKLLQPGEFHDLTEMTEPATGRDHFRDRIQYLGAPDRGPNRGRKGEFFKGCKPFKGFNHFIPDISGPEYSNAPGGDANSYVGRDEGEYFRSVHWRYLRGCPVSKQSGLGCYYPGYPNGSSDCDSDKHSPLPGIIMPDFILK